MKKGLTLLLAALLSLGLCVSALAADVTGSVTFDGKKITSSYSQTDFISPADALEPGDDVTYTVTLTNDSKEETDWYMYNIAKGYEETSGGAAFGGTYTYRLSYTGPGGAEKVIFSSDTVGGGGTGASDSAKGLGLSNATSSLEKYFALGTLKKGESAVVRLHLVLDGETGRNCYQDTMAELFMRFAVETASDRNPVRTGDDTNIVPWLAAAAISGLGLLALVIFRPKKDRREKGKDKEAK